MKSSHILPASLRISGLAWALSTAFFTANGAVPGDEHWDSQFGPVGANLQIYSVAACGGNIYIGGTLTEAGNTKANFVAGFDGTNWFPLNNGLSPAVSVAESIGSDGTNAYFGGVFNNADNSGAAYNAIWNGTNFSPLPGGGLNGPAYVFRWQGSILYVGGIFTTAGGNTVNGIARWDGTAWSALGTGVAGCTGSFCSAAVVCLAFQGSNVYAGGNFTSAGGVSAAYIARYDGAGWYPLGTTINGPVNALGFHDGYLYAGGSFTNGGAGITNLARWDGSVWSAVAGGEANGTVSDFATDGTNMYVGGAFTQIGGIAANGVASWSGSSWSALGTGLQLGVGGIAQVNKIAWQSNQLYVAGLFERAGTVGVANVARWDGSNWRDLGGAVSKGLPVTGNVVHGLLPVGNQLYAGGTFLEAGTNVVNAIGRWDGTNWNPVGSGVAGTFTAGFLANVNTLAQSGGNIFVGGNFTSAGGTPASGVAYWDGANWNALGSGLDSIANALAFDGSGMLYVGGVFTNAGGAYSRGFAVWDGSSWLNYGTTEGSSGSVNALVYDGSANLYVGGGFTSAGGVPATNIAYWSGVSWNALGSGLNGKVSALAYGNGILYAGGAFTQSGSLVVNHVAQWNGSGWSGMGGGITGSAIAVNALTIRGTNVYATGAFTNIGGSVITNIAKWDGTRWTALGSGLQSPMSGFALATISNDLYAGGTFTFAGDKPSVHIAHWNDQSNFYPTPHLQLTRSLWLTNNQFQFRVAGTSGQSYIIQASTNPGTWTPLITNTATLYDYTDTNASKFPSRWYRALLGP